MDKKSRSIDEPDEDKEENFLTKAAHSLRDKLRSKKDKKKKDGKSRLEGIGKTDSSSAVSDDDEHHDFAAKSTTVKIDPVGSSSHPLSTAAARGANSSIDKEPGETDNIDRVHISFNGISTVDDLLDRIDEVVKGAKITVGGDASKSRFDIQPKPSAPRPSIADLDKKPLDKSEGDQHRGESSDRAGKTKSADANDKKSKPDDQKNENEEGEEEPIRIDYKETQTIQDLLTLVNAQPGNRKIVLENVPDNSDLVSTPQNTKVSSFEPAKDEVVKTTTVTNEKGDSSGTRKSVLKISQDPSSLDTSTTVASLKDDQIHVNIEGVQSMDDLLDRIDGAVQQTSLVIIPEVPEETQTAPEAPVPTDNNPSAITQDTPEASNEPALVAKFTTTTTTTTKTTDKDNGSTAGNQEQTHSTVDNLIPSTATSEGAKNEWI